MGWRRFLVTQKPFWSPVVGCKWKSLFLHREAGLSPPVNTLHSHQGHHQPLFILHLFYFLIPIWDILKGPPSWNRPMPQLQAECRARNHTDPLWKLHLATAKYIHTVCSYASGVHLILNSTGLTGCHLIFVMLFLHSADNLQDLLFHVCKCVCSRFRERFTEQPRKPSIELFLKFPQKCCVNSIKMYFCH